MAEVPDNGTQGDNQPEAQQGASGRARAIVVCLFALAVIGAATANSLPNFDSFALPSFSRFSLPHFDHFSWLRLQPVLPAEFQTLRCAIFNQDGSNPDTGSRRPGRH